MLGEILKLILVMVVVSLNTTLAYSIPVNQKNGVELYSETLDNEGKYTVSWNIEEESEEITLQLVAETKGYVGFGISPNGNMDGSDLFIAGVRENGEIYSGDYHAIGHTPILDENESGRDWELLDAFESGNRTYIRVKRQLNTCDSQDFPITGESTSRLLWSMGDTDDIQHHAERGTKSVNLIPFPEPEVDVDRFKKWRIHVNKTMPSADTSYWCTIHQRPQMDGIHHVVGFEAVLETEPALKHTHHFMISRCIAPEGQNPSEVFGPWVGKEGAHCYDYETEFPAHLCEEYLFSWAIGGKRTLFPVHVGYPIGNDHENVYYKFEVHYDNPQESSGLQFDVGMDIFYTDELREHEARLVGIGHDAYLNMFVPPNTPSFVISGHCPSECTQEFVGSGGLKVFNVLLHSHLSGRKLKIRQFRDKKEIPWMLWDDNFDFNFQQNQNLREEIQILPGDHITYECTYDSTWANGDVVPGGLSTREEMCLTFLWVYGDSTLEKCRSTYSTDELVADFGVTNYSVGYKGAIRVIDVLAPEHLKGDFIEMLKDKVDWSPELVTKTEIKHRYGEHDFTCYQQGEQSSGINGRTKYPELDVGGIYIPEDKCKNTL